MSALDVLAFVVGSGVVVIVSALRFVSVIDKRQRADRRTSFALDEQSIENESERATRRDHALAALEQERQALLPVLTSGFSFDERDNARKRLQEITQEKVKIAGR